MGVKVKVDKSKMLIVKRTKSPMIIGNLQEVKKREKSEVKKDKIYQHKMINGQVKRWKVKSPYRFYALATASHAQIHDIIKKNQESLKGKKPNVVGVKESNMHHLPSFALD